MVSSFRYMGNMHISFTYTDVGTYMHAHTHTYSAVRKYMESEAFFVVVALYPSI